MGFHMGTYRAQGSPLKVPCCLFQAAMFRASDLAGIRTLGVRHLVSKVFLA